MPRVKYYQAINEALREEMSRDPSIILLGEDVGTPGGIFAHTKGLLDQFGPLRVWDTPCSEAGFVGAAIGAAATGLRPVVDLSFSDFLAVAMDQLVNQAAKMRYMSGGKIKLPIVFIAFAGAGLSAGPQHSQSWESWFVHVPGLQVLMPATAYDLKGLLKAAIRDDNPTIVLLHKNLLRTTSEIPVQEYLIPLGKGTIKREGAHVTIVAISQMVWTALAAAETLSSRGIEAEVIDPCTLSPLDMDIIISSVQKTHRVVIVHEAVKVGGIGAELLSRIVEECFDYLDAPPIRVGGPYSPVPFSKVLENHYIPSRERIVQAVLESMS